MAFVVISTFKAFNIMLGRPLIFFGHISFFVCYIFCYVSKRILGVVALHDAASHTPQTRNTQHDSADEERETQRRCLR